MAQVAPLDYIFLSLKVPGTKLEIIIKHIRKNGIPVAELLTDTAWPTFQGLITENGKIIDLSKRWVENPLVETTPSH